MSIDVHNAFIQTYMTLPPDGERVIMKVRGRLVDWLTELDPTSYARKVVYEGKITQGREHYYRLGVRKYGQLWKSVGKNTIAVCQPTQINSMFSVFG